MGHIMRIRWAFVSKGLFGLKSHPDDDSIAVRACSALEEGQVDSQRVSPGTMGDQTHGAWRDRGGPTLTFWRKNGESGILLEYTSVLKLNLF